MRPEIWYEDCCRCHGRVNIIGSFWHEEHGLYYHHVCWMHTKREREENGQIEMFPEDDEENPLVI